VTNTTGTSVDTPSQADANMLHQHAVYYSALETFTPKFIDENTQLCYIFPVLIPPLNFIHMCIFRVAPSRNTLTHGRRASVRIYQAP